MSFYESPYFIINMKILRLLGLWPFDKPLRKFLIRSLFTFIMVTALIPHVVSISKYKGVDFDKAIQGVGTALFVGAILAKVIGTFITDKKVQIIYENLLKNWEMVNGEEEKNILCAYSEMGRIMTIGYFAYMNLALLCFVTMPALPIIFDLILPINGSRPAIFILDGEYGFDKYVHYGEVYIYEAFICVLMVLTFTSVDATYAVCVQQCTGLLGVVQLRLKKATDHANKFERKNVKEDAYFMVSEAIILHEKAIKFAQILESSYKGNFLIIMGFNVLILMVGSCVIVRHLTHPMELFRYLTIFMGLMLHMFFLSWPGQNLIDISSAIIEDAYNNEWYNCATETQKLLNFMMLRSVEPITLSAGGIYILNIANFGSLAKSSISYMTVFASFR